MIMLRGNNVEEFKPIIASDLSGYTPSPQDVVTTGQFVAMIIRAIRGVVNPVDKDSQLGYMNFALHRGLIEDYDIGNEHYPIERRAAARIAHETLLIEIGEKDEKEWSAANKLQDLYICRTCVIHIAQMYVKGIMLGRDNNMFDVKGRISYAEATSIVERIVDKEKRIPQTEARKLSVRELSPEEAWKLLLDDNTAMIIDVRTLEEYKLGHIDGSVSIPLHDISNNPFSICENRDTPIILYCIRGYKSTVAASILIDAGFTSIYTIPGIEEYSYKMNQ